MATHFTDQNFKKDVLEHKGVALVDFFAEWCGPCRMMAPIIDELATQYSGKAVIGKVNVDDAPATAGTYGVRSIPTIILFKDGEAMETKVGAVSKKDLDDMIKRYL
ncbi:MAG: thioredoxin [Candidatus Wallbacteria bacterium]|nr:thioredoxin [Candidatus Wallbacteria bacterium]